MNLIYWYLIFALTSITASASGDLQNRARTEKLWAPIEIRLPQNSEKVVATGFRTDNGRWRIDQMAPQVELRVDLTSPYAAGLGLNQFARQCSRIGYGFASVRMENRAHKLTLGLPKWEAAVDGVQGPQPLRMSKVRSRMSFDKNSNTLLYANIDPRIIERHIEAQVQTQIDNLSRQGSVDIDITGHDYLACDFITGAVQIGLEVQWEYASAKLQRQVVIKADDVQKAMLEAQTSFQSMDKCNDNLSLASALFSAALVSATGKRFKDFAPDLYVSSFNSVYDQSNCRWREAKLVNPVEVAAEFDQLSEGRMQSIVLILSRFSGVIK
jgi:hypothetical protein